MATTYQRIVLASRPRGAVDPSNFRLEEAVLPELIKGEVLVRNHYLSLDPYMRGRMSEAKSYAASQAIGDTMIGGTAGEAARMKGPVAVFASESKTLRTSLSRSTPTRAKCSR